MAHSLEKLRNIGPKVAAYLAEIHVHDEEQLRALGPVEAYLQLRVRYRHLNNRMLLYALYGALSDQDCTRLPEETKTWLEEQLIQAEC